MRYTDTQKKQIAFAEKMIPSESFSHMRTYDCECRTCKESKYFHSAGTILDFLSMHVGHNTWVTMRRGTMKGEDL